MQELCTRKVFPQRHTGALSRTLSWRPRHIHNFSKFTHNYGATTIPIPSRSQERASGHRLRHVPHWHKLIHRRSRNSPSRPRLPWRAGLVPARRTASQALDRYNTPHPHQNRPRQEDRQRWSQGANERLCRLH